jgi:glycosyltransferase involved in cell wall biosynthesis
MNGAGRTRVALLSSEPIRPALGGIGVRYLELARRLPDFGFDVVLVSPAALEQTVACGVEPARIRPWRADAVRDLFADRQAVVAQGQLANDLLTALPELPVAVDLYDPWLVENLHYAGSLGFEAYRNDHSSWVLQLSRGDFFLCSSAEQRLFYLGFLTALGRVHPERLERDPELAGLIGQVPFGLDPEPPAHRELLPARRPGERRLLFGGLYDWYDPAPVLGALERLDEGVRLLVVRNPNPESTPQRRFAEVEAECRRRGWWGGRVEAIEWTAAERRFDLLREVDALVATHRPGLEADLAMRTRFLEALAVGCPAVTTAGGSVSRLLVERGAGWVLPPGDVAAHAAALAEVLAGGAEVAARVARGRALAAEFAWDRVLAPLVAFLAAPKSDPSKDRFGHRPPTVAPAEGPARRLRRWLARRVRR